MPSGGFETAIPAIKHQQTYALDRTAFKIGLTIDVKGLVYKFYAPN